MKLVRLNDIYVAPLKEYAERNRTGEEHIHCKYIGCNYLDLLSCEDCNFNGNSIKLKDCEVKFKFIEEEN